jgi:hypothetical protein
MYAQDGDVMHHSYPMLDDDGRTAATLTLSIYGTCALQSRL